MNKYTFIVKIPTIVEVDAENEDAAMAALKIRWSQPYEIELVTEGAIDDDPARNI